MLLRYRPYHGTPTRPRQPILLVPFAVLAYLPTAGRRDFPRHVQGQGVSDKHEIPQHHLPNQRRIRGSSEPLRFHNGLKDCQLSDPSNGENVFFHRTNQTDLVGLISSLR